MATEELDAMAEAGLIAPDWKKHADRILGEREWWNLSPDAQYPIKGQIARLIKLVPRLSVADFTAVCAALDRYFKLRTI